MITQFSIAQRVHPLIMQSCHNHEFSKGVNTQCIYRGPTLLIISSRTAWGPCGYLPSRICLAVPLPRQRHKTFAFLIDSVNGQVRPMTLVYGIITEEQRLPC